MIEPHPDSALLIIDVQRGSLDNETLFAIRSIDLLQHRYERVYASRFINATDSPFRKFANWHYFGEGLPDTELAFTPGEHVRVYEKTGHSAVTPFLLDEISRHAITEVHLCGVGTDSCVTATAFDLFDRGIRPVLLAGACASRSGYMAHRAAVNALKRNIGFEQIKES